MPSKLRLKTIAQSRLAEHLFSRTSPKEACLQAYLRLSRAESTGVPSLARCLGRSAATLSLVVCQPRSLWLTTAASDSSNGLALPASQGFRKDWRNIKVGRRGYVAALRFYTTIIGVLVVRASAKRKHKIQALYLEAARNGVPAKFYGGFKFEHYAMPDRINPHRWRLPQCHSRASHDCSSGVKNRSLFL